MVSDHGGYRLESGNRRLFTTWEFEADENVTVIEKSRSTMDDAHRQAMRRPGEDFSLAALHQSGGRGRRGRAWTSPPGGLWITRVIHPACPLSAIQLYSMAAAYALAEVLEQHYTVSAELKWPNDVLVDGRKIAGVLAEGRFSGDRVEYLALGLGVNVNNNTPENAVALKELCGEEQDRHQLLHHWLTAMDCLLASGKVANGKAPRWWNKRMWGIGETAEYSVEGRNIRGQRQKADAFGRLVLRDKNGKKIHIAAGSVDGG